MFHAPWIMTKDRCPTLWSEKFKEYYHSTTGAKEEAVKKFVEPCALQEKKGKIRLLDVCFGLGYKSAAALDALQERKVEIVGLEYDINVLQQILFIDAPFVSYQFIKDSIRNNCQLKQKQWRLSLCIGDARKTILAIPNASFDCVFLDPFSPKKQPELWTKDFMKELSRVLGIGGILTTYSCARLVRDNLQAAGFKVEDGPCVERRGPSTVARKI